MESILSCGVDIESVERLERALSNGDGFAARVFTEAELDDCPDAGFLACRFAAKEAFFKALGTGVSDGVRWHEFSLPAQKGIRLDPTVSGRSAELLTGRKVFASVSCTSRTAVAAVFIEERGDGA